MLYFFFIFTIFIEEKERKLYDFKTERNDIRKNVMKQKNFQNLWIVFILMHAFNIFHFQIIFFWNFHARSVRIYIYISLQFILNNNANNFLWLITLSRCFRSVYFPFAFLFYSEYIFGRNFIVKDTQSKRYSYTCHTLWRNNVENLNYPVGSTEKL